MQRTVVFVLALAGALSACGGSTATPSPSPAPTVRPTPTPIAVPVVAPDDAAAIVIATDPRFTGAIKITPDIIGASKWWTSTPLDGGGFRIELTIGWGDCPAGCINRHTWTFDVTQAGVPRLVDEAGDEVPNPLPE